MALDKNLLIDKLERIKDLKNTTGVDNTDAVIQKIADAIEAYVKTADLEGTVSGGNVIITGNLK